MGTHPIFESDFDCLTERNFWKKNRNHRKGIAITLISITKRNILITLYLG